MLEVVSFVYTLFERSLKEVFSFFLQITMRAISCSDSNRTKTNVQFSVKHMSACNDMLILHVWNCQLLHCSSI